MAGILPDAMRFLLAILLFSAATGFAGPRHISRPEARIDSRTFYQTNSVSLKGLSRKKSPVPKIDQKIYLETKQDERAVKIPDAKLPNDVEKTEFEKKPKDPNARDVREKRAGFVRAQKYTRKRSHLAE